MENINLPICGDKMWVINLYDDIEQVTIQKVTYVETFSERRITCKTDKGEYRLYKLYATKEMAERVLSEYKNK